MKKVTIILCLACVVALCCSCAMKNVGMKDNVVKTHFTTTVDTQAEETPEAVADDIQKTEPEDKRPAAKRVCLLTMKMAWILLTVALAVL